ncbi:MAG TPA: response regulator [Actinomycetota bacterium]|nr:response regulator [Actinomycetota bacterium]
MAPVVLVAEDDASVRMTIEFVLQDEGFEVLLAEDGEEALRRALESKPDVILLDQIMPKMDGKEVLSALRADDTTSSIPVLVLTGMGRGEPSDWPGATFVGKPFSPEMLVERIREVLAS